MPAAPDSTTSERPAKRPRLSGPANFPVADGFSKSKPAATATRKPLKIPVFESQFGDLSSGSGSASQDSRILSTTSYGKRARADSGASISAEKRSRPEAPTSMFSDEQGSNSSQFTSNHISGRKPPSTSRLSSGALPAPQRHTKPTSHGKLNPATVSLSSSSTPRRDLKAADPFRFALPASETPSKKPMYRLSSALPTSTAVSKPTTPLRVLRPPEVIMPPKPAGPLLHPLPPPPVISKPQYSGPALTKTITTTGIARATDPSTILGNVELLSIFMKGKDGQGEEEPGTNPLDRGLFVSPRKDRSFSAKGPKYQRGGLAAYASVILSQTRTSLSLWQRQMDGHIASSRIPTPDMKLRVLKVVHLPRFTERHSTSHPGFAICKDAKDIVHGVTLSFSSYSGAACAVNGLKRESEVWLWKPWTVQDLHVGEGTTGSEASGREDWAAFNDVPDETGFGPLKSVRRRCVDVFVSSHFYVRPAKSRG